MSPSLESYDLMLQFQRMRNKVQREPLGQQLRSMDSVWTGSVSPEAPWPEYPRPQMQRSAWLNLNGSWEFAGSASLCAILLNASCS